MSCLQWAIFDFDVHDSCQGLHPLIWLWEMWLPLLLPDNDTWQHSFSTSRNRPFCSCLSPMLCNVCGQYFPCLLFFNRNIHIWKKGLEWQKQWHLISIVNDFVPGFGGLFSVGAMQQGWVSKCITQCHLLAISCMCAMASAPQPFIVKTS